MKILVKIFLCSYETLKKVSKEGQKCDKKETEWRQIGDKKETDWRQHGDKMKTKIQLKISP